MTFPSLKNIIATCATILLTTACGGNKAPKTATDILEQARQEYADKQYDKALHSIDSLRKTFPQDIEARKAALNPGPGRPGQHRPATAAGQGRV